MLYNGIEQVTPEVIHDVATRIIDDDRKMIVIDKPTLTYTQFYMLMILLAMALALIGWRFMLKWLRRARSTDKKKICVFDDAPPT